MISIQGLKFQYPNQTQVTLDISDLEIKRGEKVFLFGPSGSGKTTLLEILAGILVPQKGVVLLNGNNLNQLSSPQRDDFRANHLGYIFQNFNLIPYLSVLENITLPLYFSKSKRTKVPAYNEGLEAENLCHRLGLENLLSKNVLELSVGQQQRVAAARALLGTPEIILADEPTSSLDYDQRERFIQLLFQLCRDQEITLIFVSHDKTLEHMFDRSISLLEVNKVSKASTK